MDNDERGRCLGELLHYSLDSRVLFSEENDVLHKMYVQHGQNITVLLPREKNAILSFDYVHQHLLSES